LHQYLAVLHRHLLRFLGLGNPSSKQKKLEEKSMEKETVVILGASNKPDRYAYKAFKMLLEYGHLVIPVNPALENIDMVPVVHSLNEINTKVTTVTLYLRPERLVPLIDEIIELNPIRIIFNPGTESSEASELFHKKGIQSIIGCTLVMLRTGQF
jgi:predicted CoA-binding protein